MPTKPRLPRSFEYRLDLGRQATPRALQKTPIHDWFTFPHSFSPGLIDEVVKTWGLGRRDRILDPFVGAGTTLLVARKRDIPAVGLDVSPLAVFVSNVKLLDDEADRVAAAWRRLRQEVPTRARVNGLSRHSRILAQAFSPLAWAWITAFQAAIRRTARGSVRDVLRLALLRAMREVCAAKSDGGWLRWGRRPSGDRFPEVMKRVVSKMIDDLRGNGHPGNCGKWYARIADARTPPGNIGKFSAVICSPPYPNRHDYTRVFAPELLLEFVKEEELKSLRYSLFRSHVEARTPECDKGVIIRCAHLRRTLEELRSAPVTDRRVVPMVEGYFRDLYILLSALQPLLRSEAKLAFVVGNVRHAGVMVEVDRILACLATSVGYRHDGTWIVRQRGNSAQQMEKFGRAAARESIVFLRYADDK